MKIILAALFSFSLFNYVHVEKFVNNNAIDSSTIHFSSKIDPEECYSIARAFGDVGIFPNRSYKGEGIKIGLIDTALPLDIYNYNVGGTYGNNIIDDHVTDVASVLCGPNGVAPQSSIYFAAYLPGVYNIENCLSWLKNIADVDVICSTISFESYSCFGKYTYDVSEYLDQYIKSSNIVFVNSLGNKSNADYIPSDSLSVNVISVGASEKDLQYSEDVNAEGYAVDGYDELLENPSILAPGRGLYGFHTQNLSVLEPNDKDSERFIGTSFSAPIVSGIIALLMEEFPSLKWHPEAINSIISVSNKNGIVNYQAARHAALNYYNYTIETTSNSNQTLFEQTVSIPYGGTIYANNFVMFNTHTPHVTELYVLPEYFIFTKCIVSIENLNGNVLHSISGTKSNNYLEFTNNSLVNNLFKIKVCINGNKANTENERACISFRINDADNLFSLTHSNYNLDTLPTFYWNISSSSEYNPIYACITFYDFFNQIVFSKNNLSMSGSFSLTQNEWNLLTHLRGREFYASVFFVNQNLKKFYSRLIVLSEPKTFGFLNNINPAGFNFPEAYNNNVINNSISVGGINVSIERLRCGYIQDQYINLSSKKTGAGHAYLQLVFDTKITFIAFGVTLWRAHELASYTGDTAIVEVKDSNGNWNEALDLLNDIMLPDSRKDILRFNVYDVYGIRFNTTSIQGGDRNKGRLCIDNICFTSSLINNFDLSTYYEPIVVRESFEV